MQVRIFLPKGTKVRREGVRNRRVALAAAALLTPASLMAFSLGMWRMAADLSWARGFAIETGAFSHWQVWMALAVALQAAAAVLNRYGMPAGD